MKKVFFKMQDDEVALNQYSRNIRWLDAPFVPVIHSSRILWTKALHKTNLLSEIYILFFSEISSYPQKLVLEENGEDQIVRKSN